MGVFCSEKPAPGIQSGSLVRSIFLQRFPGPTRRWLTFAVAALLLPLTLPGQSTAHLSATPADYGKLPLSFEANQGQSDPQVKFLAHGQGYGLFLTDRAAVLTLNKVESAPSKQDDGRGRRASRTNAGAVKTDVVRMELAGASPDLQVTGSGQLPGKANYFIGSDPAKWHAAIPTYASKHNFSFVYKHFITPIKTQVGFTYSYTSGRSYYNPNLTTEKFQSQQTPFYQDLSANISYLPKPSLIVYASCTNLLGRNNVFGYQYSSQQNSAGEYVSQAIRQPATRFLFLGVFITISKNKSVNQLPNL